jgi:hypothetical protein
MNTCERIASGESSLSEGERLSVRGKAELLKIYATVESILSYRGCR